MKLKEKISLEEVCGQTFKIRVVEASEYGKAAFTHYLHNHQNGESQFYKKEAIQHIKRALEYKFPNEDISSIAAEEALQYMLFDFKKDVPFPEPEKPKFKFIDLFAGIGGFRIAMQSLGGKCVFTSEWDEQAKKTYEANFGEVPFGDITKEETKKFIPDGFDVLCAGFPCQAFSIAGKRGGFEDTRGTLFFDVAEIIKRKQPKAIFLENVKGLFNHDKGKTLKTILNVLREDLGYYVPDPQVLNAKDFGVPQNRERIFIVGFRGDLGIDSFEYPKPTNKNATFEDVKEENPVSVKYYLSNTYLNTLVNHKKRHESKGNGFGYEIIPDDGTANAVVCGGMGRERNLVYDDRIEDFTPVTHIKGEVNRQGIRKMTPREWARLQGFPDNFIIPVADASAYKQFGNSVAVPAIKATANEIIKRILNNA
ncbi:MAG: DNA cytosine methyltransferase [Bacteroidia bacterium]|nr:DNA cytosine methyltransferase [Bacteroidia bacterium]